MFHERPPQNFQRLSLGRARRAVWAALMPRRERTVLRLGISSALLAADLSAIVATGFLVDAAYYAYSSGGEMIPLALSRNVQTAGLLAVIILLTNLVRGEYSIEHCLARNPQRRRTATLWLLAWAVALLIGFATKTSTDFSRVASAAFFLVGLPATLFVRARMVALVRRHVTPASASVSRVHLVGYEEDIAGFYANNDVEALGLRVVGTSYLRRFNASAGAASAEALLAEDLDLAVSVVRFLRPDDVFVLVPWSESADVERCIDAFLRVPAALHLRPGVMMDRFPDLQVARVGRLSGINIGRRPLSAGEVMLKRVFDLTLAGIGLILLAPLFLAVAVLIKLDSPGPVFFRQRRYGFNQQAFGVFKFRSMKVQPDGPFRQASRDDDRITRIGALLRKTNIDELPQLLNVILGDMSLVGPRPHALAHDRSFERRIALYARRHNVKPGITGWAQVNGFRGETRTDAAMEARVQADLHYIDNWSIWLDISIIVQTVISPRAYRNAF
ncbi:MAG: exopolysaccharide biosynthesis polyprenyl glycosylphosphotransferase [Methylorubrum rhodinum]|uniref:exopolysaccharide biosynthesis polyprenyl glycosylphosphotransferase n=1 Tax=Methylorubrum rhodinum TaxID=29428 RepID=UPI003BB002B6